MKKHTITINAGYNDIRTIEHALLKYFRKAFNIELYREKSGKDNLTVSVKLWKVDKNEFEYILASACKYGLKGTNLMYRENWYITTD